MTGEKQVIAVATFYRGFAIYVTAAGCAIYTDGGMKHDFLNAGEARAFVDAFIVAALKTMLVGASPLQ